MLRSWARAAIALALIFLAECPSVIAQQTIYSTNLVLPLVADTSSYQSTIYVHNPTTAPAGIQFTYTGATGSASPGNTFCGGVSIPANSVLRASLPALCPSLNAGSNFGLIVPYSGAVAMAIYSRTQTPSGNGFSIEAMVDGNGTLREIVGIARQAAVPTFQTNCFLWNKDTGRDARYVATLLNGDGTLIAEDIVSLQPGEFVRFLDIFAALHAPDGDYSNARVTFESISPASGGGPGPFIASCTVQNSTSFDADFRIGKFHN